eukprot:4463298-Amphidinium_carterae.1
MSSRSCSVRGSGSLRAAKRVGSSAGFAPDLIQPVSICMLENMVSMAMLRTILLSTREHDLPRVRTDCTTKLSTKTGNRHDHVLGSLTSHLRSERTATASWTLMCCS